MLYGVILFRFRFQNKPLKTLYSSVARTCIFPLCTETELSIYKNLLKEHLLPLYVSIFFLLEFTPCKAELQGKEEEID